MALQAISIQVHTGHNTGIDLWHAGTTVGTFAEVTVIPLDAHIPRTNTDTDVYNMYKKEDDAVSP